MKDLIRCGAPREDFQRWLGCGNGPLDIVRGKDGEIGVATLSKLPRTDDIDYLYSVSMEDNVISWDHSPVFVGVYNHQDRSLYLTLEFMRSGVLKNLVPPMDKNALTMDEVISAEVNRRVEDIVANDRDKLPVAEITGQAELNSLKRYQVHGAREEAIEMLITGKDPEGRFHDSYLLKWPQETAFIAYITDAERFVQTEAEQYIKSSPEKVLLQLMKKDILLKEYQAAMQGTDSPLYTMKAITEAVKNCGAKMVTVTVERAGEELTFKAAADSLTGCRNHYNIRSVAAADRGAVKSLFGPAGYCAADITKITCGRNTIYEVPPAQTEEMGPVMQMEGM